MYAQVEKPKENKSKAIANSVVQNKRNGKQGFGFVDNRPEGVKQRKIQQVNDEGPIIQRKLIIGGLEYFNVDHIARLLMSDSKAGWKDSWTPVLETMIRSDEKFITPSQLASYLDSISVTNPCEYIERMFVKNVVKEVDSILGEILYLLGSLPVVVVQETVQPLINTFLKGNGTTNPPKFDEIGEYLSTLKTVLSVVEVKVKDKIDSGNAKAETRAPKFPGHLGEGSPQVAGIDLARNSVKGQHIPDMSTMGVAYDSMFAERVFTVLHELTHTALGTLDKTNSLKGDARTAHRLTGPGSLKTTSSSPNYTINADSWTILIFKMRAKLLQEKTKVDELIAMHKRDLMTKHTSTQ